MAKQRKKQTTLPKILPIVMIGYGHWGRALAKTFEDAGHQIEVLELDSNSRDWRKTLQTPKLVVVATPFSAVVKTLKKLQKFPEPLGVVNCSKGIDRSKLLSFDPLAKRFLKCPRASLSGPTFAAELAQKQPTACSLASYDKKFAKQLAARLSTPYFRIYTHTDPIGVETSAAIKNVLAIAAGMADGLGLGHNARAALLSRGMLEMMRIVKALGGKEASVFGLSGIGDLWLTATGDLSRNRQMGQLLAKGLTREQAAKKIGQTVEGLYTVKQVEKLRKTKRLDLPICEKVHAVCFKGLAVSVAVESLMTRAVKSEESSSWKLR